MLSYKGYAGRAEFDPEAEIFSGEVIGTRDVITFQSDSAKELKKEFEKSVDDYLEFCESLDEEPEKPYSGKFVLRLTPERHKMAALAAKIANKSLNMWAADHLINAAARELDELGIADSLS